jgi:CRISPR-associated protein Csb1
MSEIKIEEFDPYLQDNGPAAIVFRRKLRPVEGKDSWIFPPTFAQSESADEDDEGSGGVYQVDELPDDPRKNVCVIDSVGSQANRIEPIFKKPPYSSLVPQITVKLKDSDQVNLLDAGHRAADAVLRFSKVLGPKLWQAFKNYQQKRDCSELVKLAPTSLIFGVWDSRATGAKIQRIVRSVVRAYNLTEARRSATYQAAYDYTSNGMIKPERDKGSGKENALSQEGFKYSLATDTHGGILVKGDILQEGMINLVALRTLTNDMPTKRYLLGLALVALSYRDQQGFNLREGCLLCADTKADFDGSWRVVNLDSSDWSTSITHPNALAYAELAAKGVKGESPTPDEFDKETADKWLTIEKKKRKALAKTKHPARAVADEAAAAAKKKEKSGAPEAGVGNETEGAQ